MKQSQNTDDYSWVTNEMFDAELTEICSDVGTVGLMSIPGVYELVKEDLNNEVLERLRDRRALET